jgi:hypothetical protein
MTDQARGTQAELGWVLDPAHSGHGYATEAVELLGDGVEVGLGQGAEVESPRQVLAKETVGVLVAAPLPRRLGVTEIDLHAGRDGEPLMLGHLMAQVPGQTWPAVGGGW